VSISRRIARPLLASIFIAEGLEAIRNPAGHDRGVGAESLALADAPDNTLTFVRLNGVVQTAGGVLLAIGKFPRLSALALIGSIVPTTYAGQRFWEETDDVKRAEQRMQLLKNLGLLGGLILVVVDTDGAPSVSWRTRRRVRELADSVSQKHAASDVHVHEVVSRAADASRKARRRAKRAAKRASRRANAAAGDAVRQTNEFATTAAKTGVALASPYVRHANESAFDAAGEALAVAGPYVSAGLERAGELLEEAIDAAAPYVSAGLERAGDLLTRVPDHLPADR
jgi:uncharacterized membrane protein YphA (DoxX/SURF4 family)